MRPRGDSVRLNLGELPECQVWLQVINHSPFFIEIESIKGELNYNGCRVSVENRDHIDISKHSSNDIVLLEGKLTGEQAAHCSKDNENPYVSLILRAKMRTSFRIFKKYTGDLQEFSVDVFNKRNKPS